MLGSSSATIVTIFTERGTPRQATIARRREAERATGLNGPNAEASRRSRDNGGRIGATPPTWLRQTLARRSAGVALSVSRGTKADASAGTGGGGRRANYSGRVAAPRWAGTSAAGRESAMERRWQRQEEAEANRRHEPKRRQNNTSIPKPSKR